MIVITGNSNPLLAKSIAKKLAMPISIAKTKKFEDQELRIQLEDDFNGQDVVIIQSTSKPANDNLMELLLLSDTARHAGARHITAVIPYFGYSRQDKPTYNNGSISACLVANLIESSGVDRVITLDLHSKSSESFFKIYIQNLDSSSLFSYLFQDLNNYIVVSPDSGGISRAEKLAKLLFTDLAVINKSRDLTGKCKMDEVIGNIWRKNCIIIDDIIDTGETLCLAAELLMKQGAICVIACVTHAVLSGDSIKRIENSPIIKLYVTDSIANNTLLNKVSKKIEVISVATIFANSLKPHDLNNAGV